MRLQQERSNHSWSGNPGWCCKGKSARFNSAENLIVARLVSKVADDGGLCPCFVALACGFLTGWRHSVQVGTPLCIPSRDGIDIGKIASMEINHKVVDTAKKGQTVAMKASSTVVE